MKKNPDFGELQKALLDIVNSLEPVPYQPTEAAGEVTPEFREMLLNLPKPSDTTSGYNQMTPFFGIMFDNGFSSEHYGTETILK